VYIVNLVWTYQVTGLYFKETEDGNSMININGLIVIFERDMDDYLRNLLKYLAELIILVRL